MRSWQVDAFGEPEQAMRYDTDAPEDFSPGPGEVKLKVQAAGLGLPDVFMCQNRYPLTPRLPFVLSQEACGRVVAVGAGVTNLTVGDQVLGPTLIQKGRGGLADYCLMAANMAFPVPEGMTAAQAAGFFIPFQTAWVGLVQRGAIGAGDTLLVLGATGSSGAAAVQLGKAVGARVIAVAGGSEKADFCRQLGADAVIDHEREDITARTQELTEGRGVSIIFDPVGGRAARAAFKAIAFQGRFVVIGFASGEWARVSVSETLLNNTSLIGAMPTGFPVDYYHQAHAGLLEHWRAGRLPAVGTQVFPMEQGLQAVQHIAGRRVLGKVVVSMTA